MTLFEVVLNSIFSCVAYNERPGWVELAGMGLTGISLMLVTRTASPPGAADPQSMLRSLSTNDCDD